MLRTEWRSMNVLTYSLMRRIKFENNSLKRGREESPLLRKHKNGYNPLCSETLEKRVANRKNQKKFENVTSRAKQTDVINLKSLDRKNYTMGWEVDKNGKNGPSRKMMTATLLNNYKIILFWYLTSKFYLLFNLTKQVRLIKMQQCQGVSKHNPPSKTFGWIWNKFQSSKLLIKQENQEISDQNVRRITLRLWQGCTWWFFFDYSDNYLST